MESVNDTSNDLVDSLQWSISQCKSAFAPVKVSGTTRVNTMNRSINWKKLTAYMPIILGTEKPVSIHYDKSGSPDGVLVRTLDASFILNLHDENDGKMKWDEAMSCCNMFSKEQGLLIVYYFEQIQQCLRDAGGDELQLTQYWTRSVYSGIGWGVNFATGTFDTGLVKYGEHIVRGVAAFS